MKSSSIQPRSRDSGRSSVGTRLFRLIWIRSVYGNQNRSTWSLLVTCVSMSASTDGSGSGRSSACRKNASTTCRVTSTITPSAPRLTRAAAKISGKADAEQRSTSPVPVTSVSPATNEDRQPSAAPVPWVPVEIAPPIVCRSMSPRFGMARPCSASIALSTRSGIPAWTVTCRASRSTETRPVIARMSKRTSPARAMSPNECPVPTGLTRRPA
jgi:hypothetical protein